MANKIKIRRKPTIKIRKKVTPKGTTIKIRIKPSKKIKIKRKPRSKLPKNRNNIA